MRNWINLFESYTITNVDRAALVKAIYNDMDWSGGAGEGCLHDFEQDHRTYDDDENEVQDDEEYGEKHLKHDVTTPEFMEWFAGWVENNYSGAEYDITDQIKNGHITLWRCITAPENWTPEGRHPGIYWSYIKEAAAAHWGSFEPGHVEWVMQATVPVEAIDWEATLRMAGQPDYEEEKEVRLEEGFPVTVEKYWRNPH
jgi:hypothetical protein